MQPERMSEQGRKLNGIPSELGYRRASETGRRQRTFMAWPHRADLYGDRLADMQKGYAAVARAIAEFEPVTMVAHPEHAGEARHQLGNNAEVIELPIATAYAMIASGEIVDAKTIILLQHAMLA